MSTSRVPWRDIRAALLLALSTALLLGGCSGLDAESRVRQAAEDAFGRSLVSVSVSLDNEDWLQVMMIVADGELEEQKALKVLGAMADVAGEDRHLWIQVMLQQPDGTSHIEGLSWNYTNEVLERDRGRLPTWKWPTAFETGMYARAEGISHQDILRLMHGEGDVPEFEPY